MNYCSGTWGYQKFPQLENVCKSAMRSFLCVSNRTPIRGIVGDMAWFSSIMLRHKCMLKLWNRFIYMDNTRLTKCIFLHDYQIQK